MNTKLVATITGEIYEPVWRPEEPLPARPARGKPITNVPDVMYGPMPSRADMLGMLRKLRADFRKAVGWK